MACTARFAFALAGLCASVAAAGDADVPAACEGRPSDMSWCKNMPRTSDDADHPNCAGAAQDCPCACRGAYDALKKAKEARRLKKQRAKERAVAVKSAVLATMQPAAADAADAAADAVSLLFVVRSAKGQPTDALLCEKLGKSLGEQSVSVADDVLFLHTLPDTEQRHGAWTLLPLLPRVARRAAEREAHYVVVLEPHTEVDVRALRRALLAAETAARAADGAPADAAVGSHPMFMGHALRDTRTTIIHHQANHLGLLPFPLLGAGFVFSAAMARVLGDSVAAEGLSGNFHIEAAFEVAALVRERTTALLTHVPAFCAARGAKDEHVPAESADAGAPPPQPALRCATTVGGRYSHARGHAPRFPLRTAEVVVAVKTTRIFHGTRLKLIRETWGKDPLLETLYLSDHAEELEELVGVEGAAGLRTVDLTQEWGAQVNQKRGHCAKCLAILQQFHKYYGDRKWFVIADDDTTFSLPRLFRLLQSYDSEQPLYVGERYGFSHVGPFDAGRGSEGAVYGGYDYVTMGGGVAFTRPLLERLMTQCRGGRCACAKPDEPDDMRFGHWVTGDLDLPVTHDDRFHQAELFQYHDEVLVQQLGSMDDADADARGADARHVVSFHKFASKPNPAGKGFVIDHDAMHAVYREKMHDPETEAAIRREEREGVGGGQPAREEL
eukprot:g3036.t1